MKNILMIVADQWRADCLGFQNKNPVRTPNLDFLAENGTVYTNAYCALPSCCPSRQTMLTGICPEKLGALWNYDCGMPVYSICPDKNITYSRLLRDKGYRMGYVGKWHGSEYYLPTDFGFEDYFSDRDYTMYRNQEYPEYARKKIDWLHDFGGAVDEIPYEGTQTHYQAEKVCSLIEKYGEQPWHIRMDFNEPHLPCFPCREIYDAGGYETLSVAPWGSFGDTFRNKPYMQRRQLKNWNAEDMNWSDWEKILRLEFALMEQTDRAIGKVLDLLKEKGMMENTVVIFTADHGDLCGSHRMVDKHYVLYDDIIRIPLIVMDGQGKKIEKGIVENIDFAPSVLNWAGISVPEEMQGRPLTQQGKEFAVSTFNGQQFGLYTLRAITDGQDKYIFNASDVCEYYDLRTDPDEMENRIDDEECRKRILFLKRKLYDILLDRGDKMVMNPWMKNRFLNDEV